MDILTTREKELGLEANISGWQRLFALAALAIGVFAGWRCSQIVGVKTLVWLSVALVGGAVGSFVGAGGIIGVGVYAVAAVCAPLPYSAAPAGPGAVGGVLGILSVGFFVSSLLICGLALFGVNREIAFSSISTGIFVIIGTSALAGVAPVLNIRLLRRSHHAAFLWFLFIIVILVRFGAADLLAPSESWDFLGPLLLFLGLLTLRPPRATLPVVARASRFRKQRNVGRALFDEK
jgi:hypothetical protein